MFRVLSRRWLLLLALIVYQMYLAFVASAPLLLNPLFLVSSDTTIKIARATFWYLLVPMHVVEAGVAVWLAFSSAAKHSSRDVVLWGLQTVVMGYPSLQLLLHVNKQERQRKR